METSLLHLYHITKTKQKMTLNDATEGKSSGVKRFWRIFLKLFWGEFAAWIQMLGTASWFNSLNVKINFALSFKSNKTTVSMPLYTDIFS